MLIYVDKKNPSIPLGYLDKDMQVESGFQKVVVTGHADYKLADYKLVNGQLVEKTPAERQAYLAQQTILRTENVVGFRWEGLYHALVDALITNDVFKKIAGSKVLPDAMEQQVVRDIALIRQELEKYATMTDVEKERYLSSSQTQFQNVHVPTITDYTKDNPAPQTATKKSVATEVKTFDGVTTGATSTIPIGTFQGTVANLLFFKQGIMLANADFSFDAATGEITLQKELASGENWAVVVFINEA
jgi:hypothetical protein